jgi:hypothetical protein
LESLFLSFGPLKVLGTSENLEERQASFCSLLTVYNRIKLQVDLQQVSHCIQGTLLPSSGEPKVSNPWNNA